MTYCLAIALDEGLVFCSDSRTNAGADRVSSYSKMHRFAFPGERSLVLLSAGNLATSQAVVAQIHRDLEAGESAPIHRAEYVSDVADYIGDLIARESAKYSAAGGPGAELDASVTFILGGQIAGQQPELYMVYPEGNHITPSQAHPFLQIGETKYGKPILDRIIRADTPIQTALRCAIVSLDSTMRSNVTVGPPIEVLFYQKDSLQPYEWYAELDESHPYLAELRQSWDDNVKSAVEQLPTLDFAFSQRR